MASVISSATAGHVCDRFDVSGRHAAAVRADDAPEEGGVFVVLDDPAPLVWCQGFVDRESPFARQGGHWSQPRAQSLHSPCERGMQYGFSCPQVGQVRRAWSALAMAASCAGVACRLGLLVASR